MKGDSIIVEAHHKAAANDVVPVLLSILESSDSRIAISVAGQSGSGKSETSTAIAQALKSDGVNSVVIQQDDYFVHPPKTNDATRRSDISWVGTGEVRLALMDQHLGEFLTGCSEIEKPLVNYEMDSIGTEVISINDERVAIADGTYTTLLKSLSCRVFIDRNYHDTREHREKRNRDARELDQFIDKVLQIEHEIISSHRKYADVLIQKDYSISIINPEFLN